jgi:hypothetical protein
VLVCVRAWPRRWWVAAASWCARTTYRRVSVAAAGEAAWRARA